MEVGGYRLSWVGFVDRGSGEVRPEAWHGEASEYLESLEVRCDDTPAGRGPTGQATRTGLPCVVGDVATDQRFAPWQDLAADHGLRSSVALPIPVGETIEAALCVYSSEPGDFDPEEVDLLGEVAATLGVGLHTLRLREERARTEALLRERVKELRCLVGLSQLVDRENATLEEICRGVVDLLPPAWQYPDVTCARLRLDEEEFCTSGFRATPWRLAARVRAGERSVGTLEVFYTEERLLLDEGPFLSEERDLIEAVAARVGKVVERVRTDEALRLSEERYRRLFEDVPVGLYRTTPDGTFRDVNPALVEMLGYPDAESLVAVPVVEVYGDPEDRRLWREQLDASGSVRGKVVPIVRRDGTTVWVRHSARAVLDEEGEVVAYEGAAEDVTEQRQAEVAMADLMAELRRSNEELEQFAYVASHDLQEPLRMVVSYLDLLERRLGPDLEEQHRKFLGYAVDGGRRMQRLIQDLLRYSRIETQGEPFAEVDLGHALDRALANLEEAITESGARVVHGELPVAAADAGQMVQLFQNLISNAIKFRNEASPEVRVTAEREEGAWRISVADNGIGIDPTHAERIFEIFQRLHARRHYPGTGIGLALCRRIVGRHGGRIWVESEPGEGATFHFTLPDSEEDSENAG